jgi:pyruvate-formate lyase-activating enzyme
MKLGRKIMNSFGRRQRVNVPEFPESILLEPTNACNLRCRMCPAYGEGARMNREVGFIKRDIWMNAIDEIGSWNSHVNLDIHGAGEPLMHPDFFNMVSRAKEKSNITIGFLCNATLLDREKTRAVIELGVDWICFSVDGTEKEIFEYYRRGAVLDVVEENIRYLLSVRKKEIPRISFNMVNHDEASVEKFVEKWSGLVESLDISVKRPVTKGREKHLKLIKPCPMIYRQLAVGWAGKAGLCCEDFWLDYVTGEFPKESLYDIWHGRRLNRARELHERSMQDELELCRVCDAYVFHRYDDRIIEKNGKKTIVRQELSDIDPERGISCHAP